MVDTLTVDPVQIDSGIPHYLSVCSIRDEDPGTLAHLQEVTFSRSTPKGWQQGMNLHRVRPVVLGLILDPATHFVVVVRDAKAKDGQLAPVQGGMHSNETIFRALQREAGKEAALNVPTHSMNYVGSALCPVPEGSYKAKWYHEQFFHCIIAYTTLSSDYTPPVCDATGAFATVLHLNAFWARFKETASLTKQNLLKQVLEEGMQRQLLPGPLPLR